VNSQDKHESNEPQVKEKGSEKGFLDLYLNEFDYFADKADKIDNIAIAFLKKLIFYRNYESQKNIQKINFLQAPQESLESKI
jgi:hypothetical protein